MSFRESETVELKREYTEEIRKEIMRKNAQPADVINECRVKFRNEWEAMDFQTRRDLVYGNALDRFHMAGVDEAAGAAEMVGAKRFAAAPTL